MKPFTKARAATIAKRLRDFGVDAIAEADQITTRTSVWMVRIKYRSARGEFWSLIATEESVQQLNETIKDAIIAYAAGRKLKDVLG